MQTARCFYDTLPQPSTPLPLELVTPIPVHCNNLYRASCFDRGRESREILRIRKLIEFLSLCILLLKYYDFLNILNAIAI